jgi:hypothetical protein
MVGCPLLEWDGVKLLVIVEEFNSELGSIKPDDGDVDPGSAGGAMGMDPGVKCEVPGSKYELVESTKLGESIERRSFRTCWCCQGNSIELEDLGKLVEDGREVNGGLEPESKSRSP